MKREARIIFRVPWWMDDFLAKLRNGEACAKGDKGDRGDSGASTTLSNPPSGNYRVTNLYADKTGKLVVEYDNIPIP
jgi:hypothetical protein